MASKQRRRSSTESDYNELYEAAIRDRVRDNIASAAEAKRPKLAIRTKQENWSVSNDSDSVQHDELTQVATSLTTGVGLVPQRLAAIDPRLDPRGSSFDFRFWIKTFLCLMREDGITRANANITFRSLSVTGTSSGMAIQPTVASLFTGLFRLPHILSGRKPRDPTTILHTMDGFIGTGKMLLVLGRPGSGCTTFLRTISGQLSGLQLTPESVIKYQGVDQATFLKNYHGRAVYNQESDQHFPHLTVEQTLEFACRAQTPQARLENVSRPMYVQHMVNVMLRMFGLTHVRDTKVGNDYIRGVSGGQRKRVSIAEMAFTRSCLAAWDNSTRGLDSATALDFVQHLRTLSDLAGITQAVAVYQASQSMYDTFDTILLLYEGRQIYCGPVQSARAYFIGMGWDAPASMTTPDFLTSITNPVERRPAEDFKGPLPQTAVDFEQQWLNSEQYRLFKTELENAESASDPDSHLAAVRVAHRHAQALHTRAGSAYILSIPMQIRLCLRRSLQLQLNDRGAAIALAVGRTILAFIVGSIYYGPVNTTASLQSRGSVLFLATLMNALMAVTECGALFARRPIVLKQKNFAFVHPAADAFAAYAVDVPKTFIISTLFNVVFYFITGLRLQASSFFVFFLFNIICTLMMSAIFRTIGAVSKQLAHAYAICGMGILVMIIYTGFALTTSYMHPWFRWINYTDPIAYIFEALLVNEVHGRSIPCAPESLVPSYPSSSNFACAVPGAQPDTRVVSGDAWVSSSYGYSYSHLWRNLGIAFGYLFFFITTYLVAVEINPGLDTQAQRLIFRDRKAVKGAFQHDPEAVSVHTETSRDKYRIKELPRSGSDSQVAPERHSKGVLTWEDLTLDIPHDSGTKRLLDGVNGAVTPGTLTALMGTSGAGKTTLLDTLAQRQNGVGKTTGTIKMNGAAITPSFQRSIGYVQQQDLHLSTTTVREALRFSALLRQPSKVSKADKLAYVESVIALLNMNSFADCMVGLPGAGLNVEQRKLLSIGVEMAARPEILFLDEPTSGLDSQSSWTIIALLRRLADNGQTILATIHQPSALILQQFDSILLMGAGGRTAYHGPLGKDACTLTKYFESCGARVYMPEENPAEYILSMLNDGSKDWHQSWENSQEKSATKSKVQVLAGNRPTEAQPDLEFRGKYAASFVTQFRLVLGRTFVSYWRSPAYIFAKLSFAIFASLFIGFTFYRQNSSVTAMQNLIFSIYMANLIFSTVVQQVMSRFIPQRDLFESPLPHPRRSPIPSLRRHHHLGILVLPHIWRPSASSSQGLMLGYCIEMMIMSSTWAQLLIFVMPSTETAGAISSILFTMCLQFNGVLQAPSALPGFWIFMYRISPFTYLVGGLAAVGLANRPITCAQNELARFDPPSGQTCGDYMQKYLAGGAPGQLLDPSATTGCEYCPIRNANQFLERSWISTSDGYRNLGILWAYIVFNAAAAMGLYWLFRVKRYRLSHLFRRRSTPRKAASAASKEKAETAEEQGQGARKGKISFYVDLYGRLAWISLRNIGHRASGSAFV
ncbi:ATP-dependent permease PDR15 [Cyphellophora attinorum]|uniref:ATP-dependent permease PDR15 n=1 Tax=Cyphellophora attinorum TaxID=1664694 RepID=A0A0N1HM29_9EURO|nr:ATP-dependent permease PDR15 [Phialophora attinorum]KPI38214.1 ATP-dependent permease PDR15 [Phialophora attinorum]